MRSPDELTRLASKLGGLPVLGCRPSSPAALAGVRYGDILLSVNGVATPDWSTFVTARAMNRDEMVIEVFRDGEVQRHQLSLTRAEPVDPFELLEALIDSRVLGTGASDPAPPPEPS